MEYFILALIIFFVFFYKITEKFTNPITLTNFGPCKQRDTQGKCIERQPINTLGDIKLEKIRENITKLNTQIGEFGSKVVSGLEGFKQDAKNKLTSCFGQKDGSDCKTYKDQVCRIFGARPCLETKCTGYHRVPYGCNWGCKSRNRWGACTSSGFKDTCYRNGACNSWGCARYGTAPCDEYYPQECDTYVKVPDWKC